MTAILVYAGMSLFYGAHGGLVAAVLAGLWRLFGGWMFLPVGVTLAVFLGLGWLSEVQGATRLNRRRTRGDRSALPF